MSTRKAAPLPVASAPQAGLPLTVVVPTRPAQPGLEQTLTALSAALSMPARVLVIHDADDPTVPALEALRGRLEASPDAQLELLPSDQGPGLLSAIKKGFQVACSQAGDGAVLVVEPDATEDLSPLPRMHQMLEDGFDLVVGSRYCEGGAQLGGGSLKTRLSRWAGASLRALTAIPTHDVTHAFQMYRTSLLRRVELESTRGPELSMELTVKAWAAGFRLGEVPAVSRDRADPESTLRVFAGLPRYARWYAVALGHHYLGRRVGRGPLLGPDRTSG